jgi:hypothetical protein
MNELSEDEMIGVQGVYLVKKTMWKVNNQVK